MHTLEAHAKRRTRRLARLLRRNYIRGLLAFVLPDAPADAIEVVVRREALGAEPLRGRGKDGGVEERRRASRSCCANTGRSFVRG